MGRLRTNRTYAVVLLGELDDAVQNIQQPFPAGEVRRVTRASSLMHPTRIPRRWQSSILPPALAGGCALSLQHLRSHRNRARSR